MKRLPLARSVSIVLLLLAGLAGCDLFSTRAPEPPNTGNTFIWTPATSVSYLLSNFTGTVQMVDASNYAKLFIRLTDSSSGSRTYTFVPVPGLDQASRSVFATWNVQSEQNYLANLKPLLPANSRTTLLLSNEVIDQTSNAATVTADYTLSLPVDASSSVLPSVVTGSLQLQLALVTTESATREWRIVTWTDIPPQDASKSTWSDLKLRLSS